MDTDTVSRKRLFLYALLILFVGGMFFLFFEYRTSQAKIAEQFSDKRTDVADGGLNQIRKEIDDTYGYLFNDCDARNEYDALLERDSREMTMIELERALDLHLECGRFFADRGNFSITILEQDVAYLTDHAALFGSGSNGRNASVVSKYWNDILALEQERAAIYGRLVEIQEEYWRIDLKKARGNTTSKEREEIVGTLNKEANDSLMRSEELAEDIQELRKAEKIFWRNSFGKKQITEEN